MTYPIDWDAQPLGEINDAELGTRLGVSDDVVRYHRVKRGIPSSVRRVDWSGVDWSQWDPDIADALMVAVSAVSMHRKRNGIPAPTKTLRCDCGKTFKAKAKNRRHCSPKCNRVAFVLRAKGYSKAVHPLYLELSKLRCAVQQKE